MNYQSLLPVVDGWVLWAGCLVVPLLALVTLTAFIVAKRERKTASKEKGRKNILLASGSMLATLAVLGFMLYSGLRIETNQSIATNNLMQKYGVSSVVWENSNGIELSPSDSVVEKEILVKDAEDVDRVAIFSMDSATSEPFLEFVPVPE